MNKIFISHYDYHKDDRGLITGATITTHCTRRDVMERYADAWVADPKYTDVYISEDCVISEVLLR